jgi:hypothetical protein
VIYRLFWWTIFAAMLALIFLLVLPLIAIVVLLALPLLFIGVIVA